MRARTEKEQRDRELVNVLLGRRIDDREVLTDVLIEAIAELSRRVIDLEAQR